MCEQTGVLAITNNERSVNAPKGFHLKGWFSLSTELESESDPESERLRPSENRKSESQAES